MAGFAVEGANTHAVPIHFFGNGGVGGLALGEGFVVFVEDVFEEGLGEIEAAEFEVEGGDFVVIFGEHVVVDLDAGYGPAGVAVDEVGVYEVGTEEKACRVVLDELAEAVGTG